MKNIIYIICLLGLFNCKAQSPVISSVAFVNDDTIELSDGSYLKDIENKFAPFIGTWKWEMGNSILEIEFSKLETVYDGEIYEDYLVGKYRFVNSNGNEVINSLNYDINVTNMHKRLHDIIAGSGYVTENSMQFRLTDIANGVRCYLDFSLITTTQASWKIRRQDGGSQPNGFIFPTEIIFTKQ